MRLPAADLKGINYFDLLKKPSQNSIRPWCTELRPNNVEGIEFGSHSISAATVSPYAHTIDFIDFINYSR